LHITPHVCLIHDKKALVIVTPLLRRCDCPGHLTRAIAKSLKQQSSGGNRLVLFDQPYSPIFFPAIDETRRCE
jgi:hypothetical protein